MSAEHTEQAPGTQGNRTEPKSDGQANKTAGNDTSTEGTACHDGPAARNGETNRDKKAEPPKEVSQQKVKMRSHLPALNDDADIGVEKEQIVTRDGKADLGFTGTMLASAAPAAPPKDHWQEYRIYLTSGGKHVFSKVNRTIYAEEDDTYEAEVFDPAPSSVPTQLLRSAREIARARPLTWMDAAVAFFGYDPLAKILYRKLSVQFEEQIS